MSFKYQEWINSLKIGSIVYASLKRPDKPITNTYPLIIMGKGQIGMYDVLFAWDADTDKSHMVVVTTDGYIKTVKGFDKLAHDKDNPWIIVPSMEFIQQHIYDLIFN